MQEIRLGTEIRMPQRNEAAASKGTGFGDMLAAAVKDVNGQQVEAEKAAESLITGRSANLHNTIVALEKADISFKLMMKVRDRIVDAYREVMKMGV
jgi:flagellar hook-basal body complex protein FliE